MKMYIAADESGKPILMSEKGASSWIYSTIVKESDLQLLRDELTRLTEIRDSLAARTKANNAEVRQLDIRKEEIRYDQYKVDDEFTFVVSRMAEIEKHLGVSKE
jgi:hypothetical protein